LRPTWAKKKKARSYLKDKLVIPAIWKAEVASQFEAGLGKSMKPYLKDN
jgi:hypothetical protein